MAKEKNGKETTKQTTAPLNVKPKNVKLVPPDGGWGWVIILGTSINLVSRKNLNKQFKKKSEFFWF